MRRGVEHLAVETGHRDTYIVAVFESWDGTARAVPPSLQAFSVPGRSNPGSNRAYAACSAAVRSWKAAVEARTWASSSCPAEADVAGPTTRPTLNVDQTKILKNHLRMYCPLSAVEVGIEDADLRDRV